MLESEDISNWRQWAAAVGEASVDEALRDLYARLDATIAEKPGTCELSGRCCNFERYGHGLYVTGLEVAWMMRQLDQPSRDVLEQADLPTPTGGGAEGCPFQQSRLCSVHTIRPMGCRIFFCDPAADAWLNDVYEQFLNELRQLHDRLDLPYRYMEWRAALGEARACMTGDQSS